MAKQSNGKKKARVWWDLLIENNPAKPVFKRVSRPANKSKRLAK